MLQAPGAGRTLNGTREQFTLPPLVDLKTVQCEIGNVAQALIEDRIDEDYAGELLQELERASMVLRPNSR